MNITLAWGAKVSDAFILKVIDICEKFGWEYNQASDLMSCMAFESGESFSPSIKNAAGSGAVGLIQFMPDTARGLGTSTDELSRMTPEEQLDVVAEYFQPYARRIKTRADMYMAILLPSMIGKPGNSKLFIKGTVAYRQNMGLDFDKDGAVTKDECAALIDKKYKRGMSEFPATVEV